VSRGPQQPGYFFSRGYTPPPCVGLTGALPPPPSFPSEGITPLPMYRGRRGYTPSPPRIRTDPPLSSSGKFLASILPSKIPREQPSVSGAKTGSIPGSGKGHRPPTPSLPCLTRGGHPPPPVVPQEGSYPPPLRDRCRGYTPPLCKKDPGRPLAVSCCFRSRLRL